MRSGAGVTIAGQPGEIPISEGVPLPRVIVRRVPQRQAEQPVPDRDTSQSSSSGYSPSPPNLGTMSRQPLNLSSLLTVSAWGHGASGPVASTGRTPPPPRHNRWGSTRSTSSPQGSDSIHEAGDAHRNKRPRNEDPVDATTQATASIQQPPSLITQVLPQTWAP